MVSGGRVEALKLRLDRALEVHDLAGVVSIGLGGALSPDLNLGDWVIATGITDGQAQWSIDEAWADGAWRTAQSHSALAQPPKSGTAPEPRLHRGPIFASDVIIADASTKAARREATGALAVDMESHVAAQFAAAHGLPFLALRVISDAADRALPAAALVGMRPDGGMNLPAVLRALARSPSQLPALIQTGREADIAFRGLLRCHDLFGRPGIGCPYLG